MLRRRGRWSRSGARLARMISRDFVYWLQGLFELANPESLTKEQTEMIRAHLALVFAHEIDPSHGTPEHVEELRQIHDRKDLRAAHLQVADYIKAGPCGHPVGKRACTLRKGHPESQPHAFDAGQTQRDADVQKRLDDLERMLKDHRSHPREPIRLMC